MNQENLRTAQFTLRRSTPAAGLDRRENHLAAWNRLGIISLIISVTVAAIGRASEPPALIVVVSVDQWRHDYFQRFRRRLSDQGIARRCQQSGVWFDRCLHQHAFTTTAPGHAVILTGTYPSGHGIIGNDWYDRDLKKESYCVYDPAALLIGTTTDEPPVSPQRLLADTVGDQMKLATRGASKVFAVSIKDRAAILMAGKLADAAYWMDYDGNWITTDYYRPSLPGYLRNLNELKAVSRYGGQTWQLLLERATYVHGEPEDNTGERPRFGMTAGFPHVLPAADDKNFIRQLACSPFGNDATLEAARAIIVHEKLGADDTPDLLAVSLSSTDYVGHSFGPYSLEVEDMTYRTDLALGQFADFLNEQLQEREWMMFVTADHGVAPIPERASRWKLPAVRESSEADGDTNSIERYAIQLEAHLRASLPDIVGPTNGEEESRMVETVRENQVFLNPNHPRLAGGSMELARRITRDWLMNLESVTFAATREQLLQESQADTLLGLLRHSYHPHRSGDVLYILAPYRIRGTAAATHGSPWEYDRRVPLMVLASSSTTLVGGQLIDEVSPAAIAPTIAQLLQVAMPSSCTESPLPITLVH